MGILLLGIWLILVGITWAGSVAISSVILGIFALIVGIVLIIESRVIK